MVTPPGYEIRERVHRGARSTVLRATRLSSRESVVLKLSSVDGSSASAFARSQHELSIAAPILSPHVVRYLGVERYDDHVALIEEAFGHCSLEELLEKQRLGVAATLRLGAQIAAGLAAIHDHGVTHCAIHPGNIVVDTASTCAKIIDFAQASLLPERPEAPDLDAAGMPLAYISPEQTGRMNRRIDYRTDFYSLGTVLYRALSGRLPFGDELDPLALAHAHLARPHPLLSGTGGIPVQVSRIIDRLLAKNPEDRYQSARGIALDLEECARQYEASGSVESFALGRADLPEKFLIPQKLYGRATERARLLDAFAQTARGKKILLLVEGYAGTGKSSLVSEIHGAILEQRGWFARGKFDPLARNAPYSALAQALQQLCRKLLSLPEEELAEWRRRILDGVSPSGGLIVDIVPELERVLKPQPPVPEVGLLESQHRFALTLARFLSVFAREAHPLVLFLDDLQWADPATLHALAALLRLPEPTHLLVIGAYRDNEVDATHPLSIALEEIRRGPTDVVSVTLAGLPEDDLCQFVADTVRKTPSEVRELARRAGEKTSGNPLFLAEFLRALHDERLLVFSPETRSWTWDLPNIDSLAITPDIVDLMLRKLQRLPGPTLELLRLAAAAGERFDLELLASAAGVSSVIARGSLAPAIRERLVVPLDPNYPIGLVDVSSEMGPPEDNYGFRFLHDRVQQAAYETIDPTERPAFHLRLGRILLERARREGFGERIFDVVDQLNRGADLIEDPPERIELAMLNLETGDRARRTTAYREAREYLRQGITLLPDAAWSNEYVLTSLLHLRFVECAYLSGQFEEAEAFSRALLPELRTPIEKAELYSIGIVLETNRGQFGRALELSRAALAALDHPPADSPEALAEVRARLAEAMRGRTIEDLAQLPALKNARTGAIVRILSAVYAAAYFGDPAGLFVWAVHENLRLAIEHGTTAATAVGYTHYALYLIAREREYERAMAFGKLALAIAERADAFSMRCQIHEVVGASSNAYAVNHVSTSIPLLKRALECGLESGEILYTSLTAAVLPSVMFMAGENLEELCREAELRERSIRPFRQDDMVIALRVFRQCMRCLRGETRGRTSLTTDDLDEGELLAQMRATAAQITPPFHAMYQVILRTLLGDYPGAVKEIFAWDDAIEASMSALIWLTEYGFFVCLALTEARRMPELDQRAIRKKLKEKRELLARWAVSAEVNFRHKQLLVSAELAEFKGRRARATRLYDEAIREATANGFHQHAALASELAGRAYERRGLPEVARAYRQAARNGYAKWGAIGKVRALDEDHPDLVPKPVATARQALPLDALSMVRASQALTTEIDLGALVERILGVVVQASGAERGALLVDHDGRLELEAFLDSGRGTVEFRPDQALSTKPFSEAIVRYTQRTGEDVVLEDASRDGDFTRDPYVVARASRSVLCMAVRHRDRVTGVVFLENSLASNAFTRERLDVLRLLVTQGAIALENARLYDATRELNRELCAREALLRDFLGGMPVGVYIVDAEGRLAFTNRAASAIVGVTVEPDLDVRRQSPFPEAYVAGTDRSYPADRLPLLRALRGETSMVDNIELRPAGKSIPLAIWGTPIASDDGAVRYAIVAFQDISAQRLAEDARARLEEQLHQAQRLEAIGRLAGGVAHDFNNLLTPILAYAEIAAESLPAGSPLSEEISAIREAAGQAAELTKQLLAVGRRQVLDRRVVDLNRELRSFEPMLRRMLRENIRIDLDLAPDLGLVHADASQLQRIFLNLALNAADAMPRGGLLRIETYNRERRPQSSDEDESALGRCVALRVSDTGHGMDEETLERIFDPFFTTKRPGEGTGLGLPTVYGLVKQHGGRLTVASTPGAGTCFEVILPQVGPRGAQVEKTAERSRSPAAQSKSLILVVEDDAAVRSVLEKVLGRQGHEVIVAGDPVEALRIAHDLQRPIDLLISDVVMPGMNGRELHAALLRLQPDLAVLFVSGYPGDILTSDDLLDAGIELLAKPLHVETLLTRVGEILAKRGKRSQ